MIDYQRIFRACATFGIPPLPIPEKELKRIENKSVALSEKSRKAKDNIPIETVVTSDGWIKTVRKLDNYTPQMFAALLIAADYYFLPIEKVRKVIEDSKPKND